MWLGALALLALLGVTAKRRRFDFALSILAFAALLTIASCGGGGGGGGVHNPGTPVGLDQGASASFTIGATTHAVPLSINVQ
jgi:hypothetical protein